MKKIIWTRSKEDWALDALLFGEHLKQVVHYPCIQTTPLKNVEEFSSETQNLIITSKKALRYLQETNEKNWQLFLSDSLKVWTFGPSTAASIKKFRHVELIEQAMSSSDLFTHLKSNNIFSEKCVAIGPKKAAFDWQKNFQNSEISTAKYLKLYETLPVKHPPLAKESLQDSLVVLASGSAAESFMANNPETYQGLRYLLMGDNFFVNQKELDCSIVEKYSMKDLAESAITALK